MKSELHERLLDNSPSSSSATIVYDNTVAFLMVLNNPFHNPSTRSVPDVKLMRSGAKFGACEAMLSDDSLLLPSIDEAVGALSNLVGMIQSIGKAKTEVNPDTIPNNFQKVIDIVLRLKARNIVVQPSEMIRRVSGSLDDFGDATLSLSSSANHLAGWELVEKNLFLSPDSTEMYITLQCATDQLRIFAEKYEVTLNTHPYSAAGGCPLQYDRRMDELLRNSVETFFAAYPVADIAEAEKLRSGGQDGWRRNLHIRDGFLLDTPDKLRLLLRMVREPWAFGGCGIQTAEMKRKQVLIKQFVPMHNKRHAKALGLDAWASFRQIFSLSPLQQDENALVEYFGEDVALYFSWIREYTRFLIPLALSGLILGALNVYGLRIKNEGLRDLSAAVSAVLSLGWGSAWILKWLRHERKFALVYGQDAQMAQELVRDEFEPDDQVLLSLSDIFKLNFDVPLSLKRLSDGSLLSLTSNSTKRKVIRYAVSYPVIVLLCGGLVVALVFINKWRFQPENKDNQVTAFGISLLTVVVTSTFGLLIGTFADKMNAVENNRTDSEETAQLVGKGFLFQFFSKYLAVFVILLWPDIDDDNRMEQLWYMMISLCFVKPITQNITELAKPMLLRNYRLKKEEEKSALVKGLLNVASQDEGAASPSRQAWLEATLEPYESTSEDFMEITIQFGYMAMFAATFPFASIGALLMNIAEIRVDAWKLMTYCQRPVPRPASSIGVWNPISVFLLTVALATNGYIIGVVTNTGQAVSVTSSDDTAGRYKVFLLSQYIFSCLIFAAFVLTKKSTVTEKIKAKQLILSNVATRKKIESRTRSMIETRGGNISASALSKELNVDL